MSVALRALAIGFAALVSTTAASANCGKGNFSGAYIGAAAGYAGLSNQMDTFNVATQKGDGTSAMIGGFTGYNIQCGSIVMGGEADLSYLGAKRDFYVSSVNTTFSSSTDWAGSVRGRLGVTLHPNMLLYGTAGWAYTNRKHSFNDPDTPLSDSKTSTVSSFIWGGGVEIMNQNRWSLRGEILYTDLGSDNNTYTTGLGTTYVNWKDSYVTARIGLSIKLGDRERDYVPMK